MFKRSLVLVVVLLALVAMPVAAQGPAGARLVEAYSKGLDFSLIDREKIKDSVRQAIKAEEIYNTIVDEIYAEMGKENTRVQNAGSAMMEQVNRGAIKAAMPGAFPTPQIG